jgi:transcriptional regulator with XRE-family HTH domain
VIKMRERGHGTATKPRYWRLGTAIQRARLVKEISTTDCAKRCGVSHGHWWRIEQGRSFPGEGIRQKIATVLDIPVDEIVSLAQNEEAADQLSGDVQKMLRYYLDQQVSPPHSARCRR